MKLTKIYEEVRNKKLFEHAFNHLLSIHYPLFGHNWRNSTSYGIYEVQPVKFAFINHGHVFFFIIPDEEDMDMNENQYHLADIINNELYPFNLNLYRDNSLMVKTLDDFNRKFIGYLEDCSYSKQEGFNGTINLLGTYFKPL